MKIISLTAQKNRDANKLAWWGRTASSAFFRDADLWSAIWGAQKFLRHPIKQSLDCAPTKGVAHPHKAPQVHPQTTAQNNDHANLSAWSVWKEKNQFSTEKCFPFRSCSLRYTKHNCSNLMLPYMHLPMMMAHKSFCQKRWR